MLTSLSLSFLFCRVRIIPPASQWVLGLKRVLLLRYEISTTVPGTYRHLMFMITYYTAFFSFEELYFQNQCIIAIGIHNHNLNVCQDFRLQVYLMNELKRLPREVYIPEAHMVTRTNLSEGSDKMNKALWCGGKRSFLVKAGH